MSKPERFTNATGAPVPRNTNIQTTGRRDTMKSVRLSILIVLATLVAAPGLMGQTMFHIAQGPVGGVQAPRVQLNLTPQFRTSSSNFRSAGFPSGPNRLPYPVVSAPTDDGLAPEQRVGLLQPKPEAHPWIGRITRRSEPGPLSGTPYASQRRVGPE